jgi:hypothetical protein
MIETVGFEWKQNDVGEWVFKAKQSKALNQKGVLKPEYKDLPRYKAIYGIERYMQSEFENSINEGLRDVFKILKK